MPTESFENGNANGWSDNGAPGVTSNRSSDGNYSYHNDSGDGGANGKDDWILRRSGDEQLGTVTFAYRETSNSGGVVIKVMNGSGQKIVVAGTTNADPRVEHGGGTWGFSRSGYKDWRRFTITIDWGNETFDVLWEDLTGASSDESTNGKNFINSASTVGEVEVGGYQFSDKSAGLGDEWVDEVSYPSSVSAPSTPQNLTATASGNSPDLSWDSVNWNGDQGHYNIYRSDPSFWAPSEIDQVSSGTTTYDDTSANQDDEYEYAVQAENSAGSSNLSNRDTAVTLPDAPSDLSSSYSP